MTSFLEETLEQIGQEHQDWSSLIIILPSKRACGFVRHYLKAQTRHAGFAPKIISIEQLITAVSGLQLISGEALLIEAYKAYLTTTSTSPKDGFATFCEWSSTVLADFNELDRYLVPSTSFFDYLKEIKTLERWSVEAESEDLAEKYLAFWASLEGYYKSLQKHLLQLNCGYQGMVYRQAAEDIEHYMTAHRSKKHIFIGFNALNAAEQQLTQALLENGSADVYWDVDAYFYKQELHGASRFMRRYFDQWKFYRQNPTPKPKRNYQSPKQITISNAPNQQLMVKYVGDWLGKLDAATLHKTAVVLADERLLEPLLLSLPSELDRINITMGAPLDSMPLTRWIQELFIFHSQKSSNWYYKDLFRLLDTAVVRRVFPEVQLLVDGMNQDNRSSIQLEQFLDYLPATKLPVLKKILSNPEQSASRALEAASFFIEQTWNDKSISGVERQVAYQLKGLLDELALQVATTDFLHELPALVSLWEVVIKQENLDFEGDAYDGLQIMGVLETRVLDFEQLILLSVNEGVLPAGRSNSSYITADMKTVFALPTYQDKDAIYTYHFFRLLQRAKKIQLCYNGSADGLTTGEPSRYITQLLFDDLPEHQIEQQTLSTPVLSTASPEQAQVEKNAEVIERLEAICKKGWSPSALTSYLYNPLQFYFDRVIGIREADQLEEEVAANTMGQAVHKVLEDLYSPLVDKPLSKAHLDAMEQKIDGEMRTQFIEFFKAGSFDRGKNLLIFEVAKRFVQEQIALDKSMLEKGHQITIVALEKELEMDLALPKLNIPIKLKGTIDRIDRYDGQIRIIDYKTGKAEPKNLKIYDWELLTESTDYLKAIQVLTYALLVKDHGLPMPFTAGIISFKNIQEGLMNFGKKEKATSRNSDETIDATVLKEFLVQLERLILEILDPHLPFKEELQKLD